jgi:hypothetical protein
MEHSAGTGMLPSSGVPWRPTAGTHKPCDYCRHSQADTPFVRSLLEHFDWNWRGLS